MKGEMESLRFQLELAWSQLSVFDANLSDPFNDWTEQHLAQGFTWRAGSVSFKLPVRSGRIDVQVELVDQIIVDHSAQIAIVVPFTTWAGVVEISSITQAELIEIDSGQYALLYQAGVHDDGQAWATISLMAVGRVPVEPTILRSDDAQYPTEPLLMEAEPAA
jgi:hypothetical protein